MFNPAREIFEMDLRQQDLARELENHRRVKMALQHRSGEARYFWARVGYWWHVLGRIRQIKIAISLDLREPFADGLNHQAQN